MSDDDRKGTEGFYVDANGVKQDAAFWDEMLELNPEAEVEMKKDAVRRAMERYGITLELAMRLFWSDGDISQMAGDE